MIDDLIVKCAKRIAEKSAKSRCYKTNGEFPKDVQIEILRMVKHCRKKEGGI